MKRTLTLVVCSLLIATAVHASPILITSSLDDGCYVGADIPDSAWWESDQHLRVASFRTRALNCEGTTSDPHTFLDIYETQDYTRVSFSVSSLTAADRNGWCYQHDIQAGDFSSMRAVVFCFPLTEPVLTPVPPQVIPPPVVPDVPPAVTEPPVAYVPEPPPPLFLMPETPLVPDAPLIPPTELVPVPEPSPLTLVLVPVAFLLWRQRRNA